MSGVFAGMPKPLTLIIAALLVAACLLPGTAAAAASPRNCRSADLHYPFQAGGPRIFGVFGLRIAHGPCTTAHRVARAWMGKFETALRNPGPLRIPRSVDGFRFTTLPAHEAQEFRERGQMGTTTIWFTDRIPNG
ncbi:MAG TPA: hypothetical protein VJ741_16785 [Solirubrobacteraceae bacterium]|nr:hypothetical protein [Solirubrobacteraceae bacterium]